MTAKYCKEKIMRHSLLILKKTLKVPSILAKNILSTIAHKIFERRAKTSLKQLSTRFLEQKIREPTTQNILIYDPYVEGHHALYTLELTKKSLQKIGEWYF